MPSKSPAQHRIMEGVAHNPAFAKKVGIPQNVGKEFAAKDSCKVSDYMDCVRRGDGNGMIKALSK